MKIINVDIYNQKVATFTSIKDIKSYCNKNQYNFDEIEDFIQTSHGVSGILEPLADDVMPIFFIYCKDDSMDTIIHECTHVAMFMLACIGVTVDVNEQEPIAYLIPYLVKNYCRVNKVGTDLNWD